MKNKANSGRALKAAFPHTIPIMAGYLFLGLAYGILMNSAGFSFIYPFLVSLTVYGGSLQFVSVSMLVAPFAPLTTFIMALMINVRHIFYGIAMLDKYKGTGRKKVFLIAWLTDETFSVACSTEIPEGVDRGWFYFWISFLDYSYWVIGSLIGGIAGSVLTFSTDGIEFAMTALFVVIFVEQWLKDKKHYTALIGLAASIVCRLFFGADSFLIPTMICILAMLFILKKPVERSLDFDDKEEIAENVLKKSEYSEEDVHEYDEEGGRL